MQNDKAKFKKEFISRTIRYSINAIHFADKLNRYPSVKDQLIRSATSIGANITEAQASSSRRDYIKFFEIALKSANETKYWLAIAKNIFPSAPGCDGLIDETIQLSNVIATSLLTLKNKNKF